MSYKSLHAGTQTEAIRHHKTNGLRYTTRDLSGITGSHEVSTKLYNKSDDKTDEISRVWDRYKDLAAGLDSAPEDSQKQNRPEEKPTASVQKQPTVPTGLAGIIQQYQNNKENRSKMRNIQVRQDPQ